MCICVSDASRIFTGDKEDTGFPFPWFFFFSSNIESIFLI